MAMTPRKTFPQLCILSVGIEIVDFPGSIGKHLLLWSLPGSSYHTSAQQPQYSRQKQQVMESGHTARKRFVQWVQGDLAHGLLATLRSRSYPVFLSHLTYRCVPTQGWVTATLQASEPAQEWGELSPPQSWSLIRAAYYRPTSNDMPALCILGQIHPR